MNNQFHLTFELTRGITNHYETAACLATRVSTGAIAVVLGSLPVENSRLCAAIY
jgi:hypothetical protein